MPTPTRQTLIASIRKHILAAPDEPVTVVAAAESTEKTYRIPAPPADVVPGVPTSGTTYPVFESKAEIAAAMAEPKAPATKPDPALALAYASSDLDAPRTPSPSRVLFKQAHGAARLGWDLSSLPEAIQRAARTARRPGHLERRVHDAYRTLRATFRGRPEAFRAFIRAKAGVDTIIPPT
ncbi:hypothetical protein SAMN02949497_1262 [Methylomagnum ishizawai]|uniref:Uncharacterized protein n=1 Tax=Methylomagnum ishizawai TaxID=1760988 RepID=A0A1Y6CUJ3_9GAMM|nr:hypothetical protein [Methylomagnum ishizawai]SMF93966.1 hypothetical protein SAMN02949497_1262 [Methylomagnum ishizawai]